MIKNFKTALSRYPTGIVCIFSKSNTGYESIIVNSFASVSLKPLLVLWSLDKKSSKFNIFKKSKQQVIAVLSNNQKKIANELAFKKNHVSEFDFKQILKKSIFNLNCTKTKQIRAGDHYTFFLKVNKISSINNLKPLVYHKKKFLTI